MSPVTLSSVAAVAAVLVASVMAQNTLPQTPLADKRFTYPDGIPYQVDTEPNLVRGGQFGYNQCNSTTEGPNSLCQTSFINSIDDFCLWAPSKPNSLIADTEGEEVAWCTKPGRGTRLIPAGALKGVQFMKTPDYIQVVGFIDQSSSALELVPQQLNWLSQRGNPLGGIVFSQTFSGGKKWDQVIEWHNFMGGNFFCFKACDPAGANAAHFCEHVYDRIGCAYNAPNNAQQSVFETCLGDNQDFPGVYTKDGKVMTYSQPPESQGEITAMPYEPKVPASSSCTQYKSEDLYTGIASVKPSQSATSTGTGPAHSATSTKGGAAGGSKPTGTSKPSGTSGAGPQSTSNGAASDLVAMSGLCLAGVVVSAILFL
uniref:Macrofage activating glycoprotein n=1 Tax=Moniliophthora roreri TaxID=221103 RepID=A0A0W0FL18_MONRR